MKSVKEENSLGRTSYHDFNNLVEKGILQRVRHDRQIYILHPDLTCNINRMKRRENE